jgi:hypothetical protein
MAGDGDGAGVQHPCADIARYLYSTTTCAILLWLVGVRAYVRARVRARRVQ